MGLGGGGGGVGEKSVGMAIMTEAELGQMQSAGMEADVQLGPSADPVKLIAHEFEHILEQLDGVDLASMATRVATGVHMVPGSGHFETERAIAAGRQVASEVRRGRARNGT